MKADNHFCPACGHNLQWSYEDNGQIEVHCGYGPCPSMVADQGATGTTLLEAAMKLIGMVEEEGIYERTK